jgi:predicted Zn-dependent protease
VSFSKVSKAAESVVNSSDSLHDWVEKSVRQQIEKRSKKKHQRNGRVATSPRAEAEHVEVGIFIIEKNG